MANIRRLKTLSKFLRTIPRKLFKMDNWVTTEKPENVVNHIHKPTETECGFAACAMGWACQIKSFRDAGLKLKKNVDTFAYPSFGKYENYEAAAKFFGITDKESRDIFNQCCYIYPPQYKITPIQVANRIDEVIKTYTKV